MVSGIKLNFILFPLADCGFYLGVVGGYGDNYQEKQKK